MAMPGKSGKVTREELIRELFYKHVVHGIDGAMVAMFSNEPFYGKFVEVAKGTPPTDGKDGYIDILVAGLENKVNTHGAEFVIVAAGSILARRIPPVPGKNGTDVFGANVLPPKPLDVPLKSGTGTRLSDGDANILVAKIGGVARITEDGTIEVHPYMEVPGDVTAAAPQKFQGFMRIGGIVRKGASVETGGTLEIVGGVEEGAKILCGGDLILRSPVRITSEEKADIECEGCLYANMLEGVKVFANGNVYINGNCLNSEVVSRGAIDVQDVVGGVVSAVLGICATCVGDELGTATKLDIGIIHTVMKERKMLLDEIAQKYEQVDKFATELYRFVRCNMGDDGVIEEEHIAHYNTIREKLLGTIKTRAEDEAELEKLEALLAEAETCRIAAAVVHPNVLFSLGLSEQLVKEILKNVQMRPTGLK